MRLIAADDRIREAIEAFCEVIGHLRDARVLLQNEAQASHEREGNGE